MNNELEFYIDNRQEMEISQDILEAMEEGVKEAILLEKGNLEYEVSLSLVDDDEIKRLNSEFREIDEVTDVLSFPIIDDLFPEIDNPMLGDIIISVERAKEQAVDYDHSFKREMVYLTVHSILHLLGYDHLEDADKKEMREKEKEIMEKLNIKR